MRKRLTAGLERIGFFIVPSAVALLALGDLLAAILYRGGRFGVAETIWVWRALAGAGIGLVAATSGRLYASAFYAMRDARTPVRFALARVAVGLTVGVLLALVLPRAFALDRLWGIAGLTLASAAGAWIECLLLERALARRLGPLAPDSRRLGKLWSAALLAAGGAWLLRVPLGGSNAGWAAAGAVVMTYGLLYLLLTWWFGVSEVRSLAGRLTRVGRRRAD